MLTPKDIIDSRLPQIKGSIKFGWRVQPQAERRLLQHVVRMLEQAEYDDDCATFSSHYWGNVGSVINKETIQWILDNFPMVETWSNYHAEHKITFHKRLYSA